jgi:hypothetical protein
LVKAEQRLLVTFHIVYRFKSVPWGNIRYGGHDLLTKYVNLSVLLVAYKRPKNKGS